MRYLSDWFQKYTRYKIVSIHSILKFNFIPNMSYKGHNKEKYEYLAAILDLCKLDLIMHKCQLGNKQNLASWYLSYTNPLKN